MSCYFGCVFPHQYYGYDGHGSVRYLTDNSGVIKDTYDYDAYGNLIASTGTDNNPFLFAGEQYDSDLGLYYNRARYLDVRVGRFWGMDTWEGASGEPNSLHEYLYANSDPTDLVDPQGTTPLTTFIAQLAARGVLIGAALYGTLVHAKIQADLESQYPGFAYPEVDVPGGKVDAIIVSGGFAHVYEIKPIGGTVDPRKQIQRYLGALSSRFLGNVVIPGSLPVQGDIRGPLLVERVKYGSVGGGIIYY